MGVVIFATPATQPEWVLHSGITTKTWAPLANSNGLNLARRQPQYMQSNLQNSLII